MILDESSAPYQQDKKIPERLNPQITTQKRKFAVKDSIYCGKSSSSLGSS